MKIFILTLIMIILGVFLFYIEQIQEKENYNYDRRTIFVVSKRLKSGDKVKLAKKDDKKDKGPESK